MEEIIVYRASIFEPANVIHNHNSDAWLISVSLFRKWSMFLSMGL